MPSRDALSVIEASVEDRGVDRGRGHRNHLDLLARLESTWNRLEPGRDEGVHAFVAEARTGVIRADRVNSPRPASDLLFELSRAELEQHPAHRQASHPDHQDVAVGLDGDDGDRPGVPDDVLSNPPALELELTAFDPDDRALVRDDRLAVDTGGDQPVSDPKVVVHVVTRLHLALLRR